VEEAINICLDCGYEGPEGPGEGECPECGGEMVPLEEGGNEDIDGDVGLDEELQE